MKKTVLYLSMLATMTASTGAMAEKYYYKQRLDGVKAEVNQEELDNQAMCLEQTINVQTKWVEHGIFHNNARYSKDAVYGIIFKPEVVSAPSRVHAGLDVFTNVPTDTSFITATMTEQVLEGESRNFFEVGESYRIRIYKEGGVMKEHSNAYQYAIYTQKEVEVEEKTENYDWCIENGYEVAES